MDSNIAGLVRQRFTIMIPYVDSVDAAEAAELFEATSASERLLVLRDALELVACGSASRRVETAATLIIDYGAADVVNEAFHAKIVLADGVAAYVGSRRCCAGLSRPTSNAACSSRV